MARRFGLSTLIDFGLLMVAIVVVGGGAYLFVSHKMSTQRDMERMRQQLEEERKKLAEARRRLAALLGEKRVAEVVVLDKTSDEAGVAQVRIKFLEYAADGRALEPRTITLSGDEVYFDALVILFQPEDVMEERAASIHLFRRVFTDKTQPDKGFALSRIDSPEIPEAYRQPDLPMETQIKVWEEIRQLVTDENYRQRRNVRTVFGQAVYKKLEKGRIYTLSIQNNGGLLIEDKPIPEILK